MNLNKLEAVKRRFEEQGVSISDWARSRGFSLHLTYSILSGRVLGNRGQSHRIALALGLKGLPASGSEPAKGEGELPM
jgi:gp16 family phage-associated protein